MKDLGKKLWTAIAADIEHGCLHENNFVNTVEYLKPETLKVVEDILAAEKKRLQKTGYYEACVEEGK